MCCAARMGSIGDREACKRGKSAFEQPIDFVCFAKCYEKMFRGLLARRPPMLSSSLVWPKGGKSRRQLALDLGRHRVVELIDFLRFHSEGLLLFTRIREKGAYETGLMNRVRDKANTFLEIAERGVGNSICVHVYAVLLRLSLV